MREMTRWGMAFLTLALALALGAGVGSAQEGEPCVGENCGGDPNLSTVEVERRTEGSASEEARRCVGISPVPVLVPATTSVCYLIEFYMDCSGNVVSENLASVQALPCGAVGAWKTYCAPGSGFGRSDGFCELVDYYGNHIRLRVEVPVHEFVIRPYPVGFVAREDPFGTFHPTARLVWKTPPYPSYADSGWRLWSWGEDDRGPGDKPFPCDMSEEELLSNNVPAGTTCIRMQLWASPGYNTALNPILLPGVLQFPAAKLNTTLWPEREVRVNFPYASHPDTKQTEMVRFGEKELPAFQGYFQRWWPVRLRSETKRVRDHYRHERRCHPVPDANRDGKPDRGGNCWTIIGDPPVAWPGDEETVQVIDRKEWETEVRDGLLNLKDKEFRKPYEALHPDRLRIIGPDRVWRSGYVIRNGLPYLWIPLAVREGQGAVCADPTCGGYTGPSGP